MRRYQGWLITCLLALIIVIPIIHYRATYATYRRLRVVTPGKLYRSGQLTIQGFRDAIDRYGIKTILNVQDDFPDPLVQSGYRSTVYVHESLMCDQLGVQFRSIAPGLISPADIPKHRPKGIDDFLQIMDDPSVYPVLIHCKAGLHRTGLLCAIYRMEYEHWSLAEAVRELRAHGFGDSACTTANHYLIQYLSIYRPRWQTTTAQPHSTNRN
jgi:protein tyrosine phosphatase (PTP) superfamily phosphohydrolase (DUF442 family)